MKVLAYEECSQGEIRQGGCMKTAISTHLTKPNIVKVRGLLAVIPAKVEYLSQKLSPEQLRQAPRDGERSFSDVVAHLLHCEARSSEAIYLALLAEDPLLVDIHPERQFGKLLRYNLLPFGELLAYFKTRRTMLLRVLDVLSEAQWARCIREEGKQRQESVYWRARSIALHEAEHVSELEGRLST